MATNLNDIQVRVNERRRDDSNNSINMNLEGFGAVNSVNDLWNQLHDWEWQIDESLINYNEGITYYAVPSRYKGPIDLRPYKSTNRKSEFDMVSSNSFDSDTLKTKRFSATTLRGTEYIRIKYPGDKVQIQTLGDTTDGTWTAGGAVSGLTTDSYESFDLASSVKFDYSGTSGTIDINFQSPVDISKFESRSSIYFNANFPSWTNWTNMALRIGHDLSSNYWTATMTSDYLTRTPTDGQWNTFGVAWSSFTSVGTPSAAIVGSARLTIVYSSNPDDADLRIENLFVSENVPILFEHYKTDMVVAQGTGSARTQRFTSSANIQDMPLWGAGTGKYDFILEPFVSSTLENIFWITGEYKDFSIAQNKVVGIVDNLKKRIPSRRRYPSTSMKFDIN